MKNATNKVGMPHQLHALLPIRIWGGIVFLLLSQQVFAQIYVTGAQYSLSTGAVTSTQMQYYDIVANTFTAKASPPANADIAASIGYNGKIYGAAFSSFSFYMYDPATDVWTAKASTPFQNLHSMIVAGNYIYAIAANSTTLLRYNPTTNVWTVLADKSGANSYQQLSYDGGNYIYCISSYFNIGRYNITTNTWTDVTTTALSYANSCAYIDGKLYYCPASSSNAGLFTYDIASNTHASVPSSNAVSNYSDRLLTDGTDLYVFYNSGSGMGVRKWIVATNTLGTVSPNKPYGGKVGAAYYVPPPCTVATTASATKATCTGLVANSDAKLTLSTYSGGITKVGYSIGTSYTGPAFASATTATAAPMAVVSTLPNPNINQPYTIRAFRDASCYTDVQVMLPRKRCSTADLSLSISPPKQSGASGELLTYVVTLNNAGPHTANNVTVEVPMPTAAGTYISATAQQGSYTPSSKIWNVGNMAVGSQTLTFTIKVQ